MLGPRPFCLSVLLSLQAACTASATQVAPALPAPARDLPPGASSERSAVFAGGCFWCVEAVFEALSGVKEVVSGYAGGAESDATYERVSAGETSHAEVVRVVYDPRVVSYGTLLHVFFSTHDPTTKDRQGPDRGRQYRSAIFYADEAERAVAASYLEQLAAARAFPAPLVTTLERLQRFHPAESYHQDFVARNPDHGYVRQWALPKLEKLKKLFPSRLRGG